MATKPTSTVREMGPGVFDSFSTQFDRLTQAVKTRVPVLHTCVILYRDSEDSLIASAYPPRATCG